MLFIYTYLCKHPSLDFQCNLVSNKEVSFIRSEKTPGKSEITKITNSVENSNRKVTYKMQNKTILKARSKNVFSTFKSTTIKSRKIEYDEL